MRILVTGGAGAIGSWVVRDLLEAGHEVTVYDIRPDLSLLTDLVGQFRLVRGDTADLAHVLHVVQDTKPERIIHLAGTGPQDEVEQPTMVFNVHADGIQSMLEATRLFSIERLVFASTKSTFGALEPPYGAPTWERVDEDHRQRPDSIYGIGKLAAENLAWFYNAKYQTPYIALRFPALYGVGRLARHGTFAFVNRMLENAMQGLPTRLPAGQAWADELLNNRDVAHGVVLAATISAERLHHHVYHIFHGAVTNMQDVIGAVHALYPEVAIDVGPGGYNHNACLYDTRRASEDLGYAPRLPDLRVGLEDMVAWMTRLGMTPLATPNA